MPSPVSITVAIPTHNRRETLLMALQSALSQSRPPQELIVLADGCTDDTCDAVRALDDPRLSVLDLPKGPGLGYGHRNEALRRASGEVIAWLSDDDLWLPDHLERVGEIFDAGLAELVQAETCVVARDGTLAHYAMDWRVPSNRWLALEGGDAHASSSSIAHLVRCAPEVGGWHEFPESGGDADLWCRMLRAGARTAMSGAPTVLFFSSWRREQPYPERVAQNAGFLARMAEPHRLSGLRSEMTLARERDRAGIRDHANKQAEDLARLRREIACLRGDVAARDVP